MNTSALAQAPVAELSTSRHAELVVRVIESAASVQRRHQFFVWAQSYLQMLLPHDVSVCAAYQRDSRELVFDTFHNVPVSTELLAVLGNGQSGLMRELVRLWVSRGASVLLAEVAGLEARVPMGDLAPLRQGGITELLVHAVARPQRPAELESLFVLAASGRGWQPQHCEHLQLLLPHLHTTYVRTQGNERELGAPGVEPPPLPAQTPRATPVTTRERQILRWVREGKTNAEIAIALEISPLTVKNHVQKILRKLTAANRAQAVALAIQQNLL
ncbi:LuxR family transcriptional regulator [Rubrivivax sp. A210]|uniref:LuxR C-terminal-related transcriptional regulator n=1 Tax=Rubrivivax sp. A210 TaxID=2772301 RepID=UPI00191B2192|nr:LuxR C-terminal-related transcriptional regulator [Rubrivivax sp. A210]CAD5373519.1 LuxR family transcriptional regulator [Rubrivivax sp. A210]